MMRHFSAVSMLLSTHSSFPSPTERGSHPALPEGRLLLGRCRYLIGGSRMIFRSKFSKGWFWIPTPDIPSMKFIPVNKGCICKRLQCLQHKITASDFYRKLSIGQHYIKTLRLKFKGIMLKWQNSFLYRTLPFEHVYKYLLRNTAPSFTSGFPTNLSPCPLL